MIRAYVRNPWEAAAVGALAAAGAIHPFALAGAGLLFCGLEIAAGLRRAEGPRWLPSWWPRVEGTVVVLYDATCVLCSRSKERLERWATASHLRFLPLQSGEARALLPGMPEKEYMGAMHVFEEGRLYSAHEGWFRLMRLGPLPLALLGALLPRPLAKPLYALVARNRYRWFGRTCDTGSCQVHPREHAES